MFLQKRIHEWSEGRPDWQRDLLRRFALGPLSDSDRAEVLANLMGSKGGPAPVPLALSDLPLDEAEQGRVELRSIGDLQNINGLAEGETLPLEPGLNVVFGKNATGKTGHGRLLRGVCRASDREEVLRDVFEPTKASKPQTAEFVLDVDGTEQPVSVDLAATPDRLLSAISIFDASCARVYLTKPNVIAYVPQPLVLLKSLADEQDALAEELRERASTAHLALPQLLELDPETQAGAALAAIGATTDIDAITQLATLTEDELSEFQRLEASAAAIRADKSGELEQAARIRAAGAEEVATAIRTAAALVDDAALARLADTRQQLTAATRADAELADRAFARQRFPGTGQEAWLEMWAAAKRFVEAGGGQFPTTEGDPACPVCQQDLDAEAQTRVATFEEFVRSDLRDRAATLERELKMLLGKLPDLVMLRATIEGNLRGVPEEIVAVAAAGVSVIEAQTDYGRALAENAQTHLLGEAVTPDIAALDSYAVAQTRLAEDQARLRDPERQGEVLRQLAELQSRQSLLSELPKLKKRIAGLQEIAVLEAAVAELNTQAISHLLRKLQEATVTGRLRAAIRKELEGVAPETKIDVVGKASKGETVISLQFADPCRVKVDRVLSTGQQTTVATAFFLAELAVSEGRSAVVLEDPVSSLDHDRREYLAGRLVEEAQKRQVVIYTHDLTFLYYLQAAAEEAGIDVHGRTLERTNGRVGVVREELPTKNLSPSKRRKELRRRLRRELVPLYEKQDSGYEAAADDWVVDLRKGYDQLIEEYLLAGVVRRNHQQVRVRQLFKVKWTLELAKRIEKAMKQTSTKAHHESPELYPEPRTPKQLERLLEEFDAVCEETKPKNEGDCLADDDASVTDVARSTPVEPIVPMAVISDELVAKGQAAAKN